MIHIPHCGLQYFRTLVKFGVVNSEFYFYRFLGFCSSKEFMAHIVRLREERSVAELSKWLFQRLLNSKSEVFFFFFNIIVTSKFSIPFASNSIEFNGIWISFNVIQFNFHAMSFNIFIFSLHAMHVEIYVMHISPHMSLQNDCISNMFMLNLLHMKMKTTINMQTTFCFPCVPY
jgi:hypothetical protein